MLKRILVPLDGSPTGEGALPLAGALARTVGGSVDLILVHQPTALRDRGWDETLRAAEDRYVGAQAAALAAKHSISVTHTVPSGNAVATICDRVLDISADLIVMTSHGRTGLSRLWLGSVADGVVRHARAPILMLHPRESQALPHATRDLHRIMIPLDGSLFSEEIVPAASAMASACGAEVLLFRVVPPVPLAIVDVGSPTLYPVVAQDEPATRRLVSEAEADLVRIERDVRERGVAQVRRLVVIASAPASQIISVASDQFIDVIALSTHGRGASRLVIGSVADKVLRGTEAAILLQRPAVVRMERLLIDAAAIEEQLPALYAR